MAYNVFYDAPDGVRKYALMNMCKERAELALAQFKSRYLNPDGTPKEYPNKKGFYSFTNPRVEEVSRRTSNATPRLAG